MERKEETTHSLNFLPLCPKSKAAVVGQTEQLTFISSMKRNKSVG